VKRYLLALFLCVSCASDPAIQARIADTILFAIGYLAQHPEVVRVGLSASVDASYHVDASAE
jgi:uncharacterized protein YcfL